MLEITHWIGCLRTRLGRTGTVRIARLTGVDLTMKRPTIQSPTTERFHSSSDDAYADLSRRKHESKDARADDKPTTNKLPRTYTTRESVEEALRSDRYQSAVVVLRKDFPANQPFRSWHEILDWLQNDVRPIADELDVR
ncbi:hypothetical protein PSTT_04677 [Puccinia striiformis]|uniref:Uncharacterized protein n=1 Tax=Puccinia striiformis TaxID=27350 RepID=A0A2S4VRI0_9BASI|nr:hypothetical protein PSTT_04677 [Puccinia striiformis]